MLRKPKATLARLRLAVPILLASTSFLHGHDPGLSTATVVRGTGKLEATLVFSIIDTYDLVEVDKNRDGKNSNEELQKAALELQKTANESLELKLNGELVPATDIRCHFDGNDNATVELSFPLHAFTNLVIRSKWLSVLQPGHRQLFVLRNSDGEALAERMLTAKANSIFIDWDGPAQKPVTKIHTFADFLLLGVKHIWTGYDHLLFLLGLLIVTRNFASSIKIITCFTIAHSITLAVATLSLVQISSRIVEPLIAASIVYVGLENLLRGDDPKGRWLLTFAFGLIHGFGFASVLRELGVGAGGGGITVPLVSFNLGVELGQLVIAGLALPVIWKLRTRPVFIARWVPACSAAVAALGGFWFVQRVWFGV